MKTAIRAKNASQKSASHDGSDRSGSHSLHPLNHLADRLGNRGMQRLRPIQRKCTCGGSCPTCRAEGESKLQRKSAGEPPLSHGIALAHKLASRPGEPLQPPLRSDMEAHFGADFSSVRIHTDSAAADASRALHADAFTTGAHIALAPGRFGANPSSRQLIAHELTHVIQQASGAVPPGYIDSGREDPFEYQARAASAGLHASAPADAATQKTAPTSVDQPSAVQREEAGMTSTDAPQSVSEPEPAVTPVAADPSARYDNFILERIRLILSHGRLAAHFLESHLEALWNAFGERLPAVATANFDLFQQSVEGGMDLDDIDALEPLRDSFASDVRAVAMDHLLANRQIVNDEQYRLRLDQPDVVCDPTQEEGLQEIQRAAHEITEARRAMAALRHIPVGYREVSSCYDYVCYDDTVIVRFDPKRPPDFVASGDEDPQFQSYDEVKKYWDRAEDSIKGLAAKYPVAYGGDVQGQLGALAAGSPEEARGVVRAILGKAIIEIEATADRIREYDLEYWDLKPIHQQLFTGQSGTGLWATPFFQMVAEEDLSDKESDEILTNLGIGLLAMIGVAGLVFLTGGAAAVALTAGGIAGSAVSAGLSWEKYIDFASAAQATVTSEHSLLASGQVKGQFITATLDSVFLFLDVAAPLWKATRAASAGFKLGRAAEREGVEKALEEAGEAELKEAAEKGLLKREGAEAAAEALPQPGALVTTAQGAMKTGIRGGGTLTFTRGGMLAVCHSPCEIVRGFFEAFKSRLPAARRADVAGQLAALEVRAADMAATGGRVASSEAERLATDVDVLFAQLRREVSGDPIDTMMNLYAAGQRVPVNARAVAWRDATGVVYHDVIVQPWQTGTRQNLQIMLETRSGMHRAHSAPFSWRVESPHGILHAAPATNLVAQKRVESFVAALARANPADEISVVTASAARPGTTEFLSETYSVMRRAPGADTRTKIFEVTVHAGASGAGGVEVEFIAKEFADLL